MLYALFSNNTCFSAIEPKFCLLNSDNFAMHVITVSINSRGHCFEQKWNLNHGK